MLSVLIVDEYYSKIYYIFFSVKLEVQDLARWSVRVVERFALGNGTH